MSSTDRAPYRSFRKRAGHICQRLPLKCVLYSCSLGLCRAFGAAAKRTAQHPRASGQYGAVQGQLAALQALQTDEQVGCARQFLRGIRQVVQKAPEFWAPSDVLGRLPDLEPIVAAAWHSR